MLNIYNYHRPEQFLKDAWLKKKKANPAFSLRAWSKKLGFENNAPLSLMLAGKRPIPRKYLPLFIDHLGLSAKEGLYLETLVEYAQCRNMTQKEYYAERLRTLAPDHSIRMVEIESFKFLGDPLHTIILEMTDLKSFEPSALWIQKHLKIPATLLEIETVVERLLALGLIQESADGNWRKTNRHLTNRQDIADRGSQEYHKNTSLLASQRVLVEPVLEREFNGYALNLSKKSIPLAKQMIRDFIKDFIAKVEASAQQGEETFQFNVQLFSVSGNDTHSNKQEKK